MLVIGNCDNITYHKIKIRQYWLITFSYLVNSVTIMLVFFVAVAVDIMKVIIYKCHSTLYPLITEQNYIMTKNKETHVLIYLYS